MSDRTFVLRDEDGVREEITFLPAEPIQFVDHTWYELRLPLPWLADGKLRVVHLQGAFPVTESDWAHMLGVLDSMKPALVIADSGNQP